MCCSVELACEFGVDDDSEVRMGSEGVVNAIDGVVKF